MRGGAEHKALLRNAVTGEAAHLSPAHHGGSYRTKGRWPPPGMRYRLADVEAAEAQAEVR